MRTTTPRSSKKTAPRREGRSKRACDAKLDEMIAEATVDAHDQSEQTMGFYTMLEVDFRTFLDDLSSRLTAATE